MKYEKIVKGKFIERPNRFVALVEIEAEDCLDGCAEGCLDACSEDCFDGAFGEICRTAGRKIEKAHVKNTGRCRELLVPGAQVYLEDFEGRMGSRKMRYSLVAVEKVCSVQPYSVKHPSGAGQPSEAEQPSGADQLSDVEKCRNAAVITANAATAATAITEIAASGYTLLVNMDSQAPNKVVAEALADGRIKLAGMDKLTLIKTEKTFGESRFDFYCEDEAGRSAFIEVKGVTLEEGGACRFPDAPTERGVRHVRELCSAMDAGHMAFVIFVVQMEGMKEMRPNDETHRAFGDALREARARGVKVLAFGCRVGEDWLEIGEEVPVNLD